MDFIISLFAPFRHLREIGMKGITIGSADMAVMATRLLEHLPRLEKIEVAQVIAFRAPIITRAFVVRSGGDATRIEVETRT